MKGKIILCYSGMYSECEIDRNIFMEDDPYGYAIHIDSNLSKNFQSLISTTGNMEENVEIDIEIADNEEQVAFYKKNKGKLLELLQNAEYVTIYFPIDKIIEYLKSNPILQTKKVIINQILKNDYEVVNKLKDELGENTSNIYFYINGNHDLIDFSEYSNTVEKMNEMLQDIDKFNFSPLEKIMYVYDIVRDRIYNEVAEGEDKHISRNLSSALLGDHIVCVGYAKIFKALLNKLGITCTVVSLCNKEKTGGHNRNVIYIKDDKYGVDGVYYFDPTYDSKENEDDNSFLLSYKYFAMTRDTMIRLDKGEIIDESFPYSETNVEDISLDLEEIIEENGFENIPEDILRSVNTMSILVSGESLISILSLNPLICPSKKLTKDEVIGKLDKIVEHFVRPLSADTLLRVLYNVRKQQYYSNPDKYQFGLEDFFQIVIRSGWNFEEDKLYNWMMPFLSVEEQAKIKGPRLMRYSSDTDLEKNIEQVKLAKVLRLTLDKKMDSEKQS